MKISANQQRELINQQIKELIGIYRGAVSHTGISENEFWIWYTLIIMEGEYTQQDICSAWSLSKQTVNTIITHMVRKNYVVLEVMPGTRNRKLIRLTEVGRKYGERVVRIVSDAEVRTLARMSVEEYAACMEGLGKYIAILREELDKDECYGNEQTEK